MRKSTGASIPKKQVTSKVKVGEEKVGVRINSVGEDTPSMSDKEVKELVDVIPLPEPFYRSREATDGPYTAHLDEKSRGKPRAQVLELGREGELLESFIRFHGINKFIKPYDNWLKFLLKDQIYGPYKILDGLYEITFQDPKLSQPYHGDVRMTPHIARTTSSDYMLDLHATIKMKTRVPKDLRGIRPSVTELRKMAAVSKERSSTLANVLVARIPLMVGSSFDITHGMSPEALIEMGECPSIPSGYFIVNGAEKVIQNMESLGGNLIIVSDKNGEHTIICKATCSNKQGLTRNVKLMVNKEKNAVLVNLQFIGRNMEKKPEYFPLYTIYNAIREHQVYYDNLSDEDKEIVAKIVREENPDAGEDEFNEYLEIKPEMTHEDYREMIQSFFTKDNVKTRSNQYLSEIINVESSFNKLKNMIAGRPSYTKMSEPEKIDHIKDDIVKDSFIQMTINRSDFDSEIDYAVAYNASCQKKLFMYSMMAARLIECHIGTRPLDDVDDWGNKKLDTAPELLKQLFNTCWTNMVEDAIARCTENIEGKNSEPFTATIFQKTLDTKTITDAMTRSIRKADAWGSRKPKSSDGKDFMKSGVSVALERESALSIYTQLTRINVALNANNSKQDLRMVQPSQTGYICIVETPEGKKCGITKYIAITCVVSTRKSEQKLMDILVAATLENGNHIMSGEIYEGYYPLIVSGRFEGWCEPNTTRRLALEYKRDISNAASDISIWVDENDRVVYIYMNEGRLCRPLLILDKDEKPIISKSFTITENGVKKTYPHMWGMEFQDLLKYGAIEYISAKEQDMIIIAASQESLNVRHADEKNGLDEARKDIELLKTFLSSKMDLAMINISAINDRSVRDALVLPDNLSSVEKFEKIINEQIEKIQDRIERITSRQRFTHMEMTPDSAFGVSASLVPYPAHGQGPRFPYQCSMGKQTLSITSNIAFQKPTSSKVSEFPTPPIAFTQMEQILKFTEYARGNPVIVMFATNLGYNQEDAIIFNRSALDRGLFKYTVYHTYTEIAKAAVHRSVEKFMKPKLTANDNPKRYAHLNENGLPMIGTQLFGGDILLGKVIQDLTGKEEDKNVSIEVKPGHQGVVDDVIVINVGMQYIVKVKLRDTRIPQPGDKFAARYAQKGTMSIAMDEADLPYTKEGLRPSIIINPHSITSRMTIGWLIELISSSIGLFEGHPANATAFRKVDLDALVNALQSRGFVHGKKVMYNPFTGKVINGLFTIGVSQYQQLRHLVADKIQARGTKGPVKQDTRQPRKGRSKGGGLRVGWQENDALRSSGAAYMLKDRLCDSSDKYTQVYCKVCNTRAHMVFESMSSRSYNCSKCSRSSSTGEDFVRIDGRHSLKVLQHLTAGMGIKLDVTLQPKDTRTTSFLEKTITE